MIRGWLVRPIEAISARFASVGTGVRREPDEDDRYLSAEMAKLAAEHRRISNMIDRA